MWYNWFPWKFIIKQLARSKGFVDPVLLLSKFNRFAQPSEVWAPLELMRAGIALHARGLINSQVIQHNLDWVWPYWIECQFNPQDSSFIPRAFSLTQINLTHRNWTAIGIPGFDEIPIVDPRGLVMPFFDSWSIDSWIISSKESRLIPSREKNIDQKALWNDSFTIQTNCENYGCKLESISKVVLHNGIAVCRIKIDAQSSQEGFLVVSLRPYNPEGISFIHRIDLLKTSCGWLVDKKHYIFFDKKSDQSRFSNYHEGDVYHWILSSKVDKRSYVQCNIGMATASMVYLLKPQEHRDVTIDIPLDKGKKLHKVYPVTQTANEIWQQAYEGCCKLKFDYRNYEYLYGAAVRTVILHTPKLSYAGPYTYKRFWFRDAAYIINALICSGKLDRAEKIINSFFDKQNSDGYFLSQQGEWDSNGEALWSIMQYCQLSGKKPPTAWKDNVIRGAEWIVKKRVKTEKQKIYTGLFPSGFSAEHLGPNDYYFWDNFWGVAGLNAAVFLLEQWNENKKAEFFKLQSQDFMNTIVNCLKKIAGNMRRPVMPASPYRRPDSGAVGSLVAGYPLFLWPEKDQRLLLTANYLFEHSLINNAFYHDISHSGINPYLTLHIAQVFMRAGDERFRLLVESIAELASSTGQWPEAIHPRIKSGCMGDGQHVWAASEWILIIRNSFIREERSRNTLVLCAGIYNEILQSSNILFFGPAYTAFGFVKITIEKDIEKISVQWECVWFQDKPPLIEISFPGKPTVTVDASKNACHIPF